MFNISLLLCEVKVTHFFYLFLDIFFGFYPVQKNSTGKNLPVSFLHNIWSEVI